MNKFNFEEAAVLGSVILGFFQVFLAAHFAVKQRGIRWNVSSREGNVPPLTGAAARLDRTLQNFKETFPFFLAAVFLVAITESGGTSSRYGSILYLIGRVAYIPLYGLGITGYRTAAWFISIFGIGLILLQPFF